MKELKIINHPGKKNEAEVLHRLQQTKASAVPRPKLIYGNKLHCRLSHNGLEKVGQKEISQRSLWSGVVRLLCFLSPLLQWISLLFRFLQYLERIPSLKLLSTVSVITLPRICSITLLLASLWTLFLKVSLALLFSLDLGKRPHAKFM